MRRIQFEISKINEYRNTLLEFRNQYVGLEAFLLNSYINPNNEKEKRINFCILLICNNEKLASTFINGKIHFLKLNYLQTYFDCLFVHKVDKDRLNND